jgi:hypothetical protein
LPREKANKVKKKRARERERERERIKDMRTAFGYGFVGRKF